FGQPVDHILKREPGRHDEVAPADGAQGGSFGITPRFNPPLPLETERPEIQDARIAVRGNAALVNSEPQTRRHSRSERQSEAAAPVHGYVSQNLKVVT